jgi:uncharacterized membrane protein
MPLSDEQLIPLSKPMRNLKIICGALLAGICMMGLFLGTQLDFANLSSSLSMLVALAAASAAVMFSTSFVAFKVLSAQTDARSDTPEAHFQVLQSAWIVRFAIIEGACFMNLIVTLLENSLITLFVALVGVLIMVIGFPRSIKVEELLEDRLKA